MDGDGWSSDGDVAFIGWMDGDGGGGGGGGCCDDVDEETAASDGV